MSHLSPPPARAVAVADDLPLADLPPLEPDDDATSEQDTGFSDLLTTLDELGDDAAAEELDDGVELSLPDDAEDDADDDPGFPPGAMSAILTMPDTDTEDGNDEAPELDDGGYEIAEFTEASSPGDDADPPTSAYVDMDELPPLEPDDGVLADAGDWLTLPGARDEADCEWTDDRYEPVAMELPVAACRHLCSSGSLIVAGGREISVIDPVLLSARPLEVPALDHPVQHLAIVRADPLSLICSTAVGGLLEIDDSGGAVLVDGARVAAGVALDAPSDIEVLVHPGRVFALLGNGALVTRSPTGDSAWSRIETPGRARHIAGSGPPLFALLRLDDGWQLGRLEQTGTWTRSRSDALSAFADDSTLMAACGAAVILADPQGGVLSSRDGGETFTPIAGVTRVTALAVTEHAGAATAFAATFHAGTNSVGLVAIDLATGRAERIAELDTRLEYPDGDESDAAIQCLAWHPESLTLWASGEFGVLGFKRP